MALDADTIAAIAAAVSAAVKAQRPARAAAASPAVRAARKAAAEERSAHWKARDIFCPVEGCPKATATPGYKSLNGLAYHTAAAHPEA